MAFPFEFETALGSQRTARMTNGSGASRAGMPVDKSTPDRHPAGVRPKPNLGAGFPACPGSFSRYSRGRFSGQVAEWLKEHAWKACIPARVSRVRIPPCPPEQILSH